MCDCIGRFERSAMLYPGTVRRNKKSEHMTTCRDPHEPVLGAGTDQTYRKVSPVTLILQGMSDSPPDGLLSQPTPGGRKETSGCKGKVAMETVAVPATLRAGGDNSFWDLFLRGSMVS